MKLDAMPFGDRIAGALPYLATAAIVIGFINFFWFIGESISMGDASQGRIVGGHYFLGNKGTYTEVTKAAWDWSVFHGASIFITHPLALAGMAYVTLRKAFPAQMAGTVAADSEVGRQRIELVRGSGPAIAEETMGGRVGPLTMTAPLLKIWVHPKGLIVRAMLGNEHAILAAEVVHLGKRRVFFQEGVEIEHLGMGSKSPLILYRPIDDPIVTAIRRVVTEEAGDAPSSTAEAPASAPVAIEPAPFPPTQPVQIDQPDEGVRPRAGLGRWSLAGEPAIPGLDPHLSTVLEVLGLGVGVVLIAMGLVWAIPKLGVFGIVWTIVAAAILAWNGSKFVRRHFIEK